VNTSSSHSHWQTVYYVLRTTMCFFCSANIVRLSICTHSAACKREKWQCSYRKDSITLSPLLRVNELITCVQNFAFKFEAVAQKKIINFTGLFFAVPRSCWELYCNSCKLNYYYYVGHCWAIIFNWNWKYLTTESVIEIILQQHNWDWNRNYLRTKITIEMEIKCLLLNWN